MEKTHPYHHGNLRNELIEKAIGIVSGEGEQGLSVRKLANACGVSYAAPYSHFKNKEELLLAMQEHIIGQFTDILENEIIRHKNSEDVLLYLGEAYVNFFLDNPYYYSFLYTQSNYPIILSPVNGEMLFRPYEIFKDVLGSYLKQSKCQYEKIDDIALAMLASVHGITALATMKNIHYQNNWKEKTGELLKLFSFPHIGV